MTIVLTAADLRAVTAYAAGCAQAVLGIFEADRPHDPRPRAAVDAAWEFARGGPRGKALRDAAWAALRAAADAGDARAPAASEAARAAMAAAGAAYLHALPNATQVKHILGAAAHATRAEELAAGDDRSAAVVDTARVPAAVVDVLRRYPPAPSGGGRVGELVRVLDAALRP